ncbi:MAG TPA: isochorismatase family cysteine hydrolase [Ramlibacter sp.]|jgi:nicotinamidase-related amidase|nr:isochorismatase family cysteine hydrolase [Ramlibacter sp.]
MNTPTADYIRAYMPRRDPDPARSALLLIDLQYASGSRQGALGRKMKAEGSTVADYRFDRIERSVVPNAVRMLSLFRRIGRPVLHVTVGAATPDARDAPVHMRKLFSATENYVGSHEHEILAEVKPQPGEHVIRKTTIGAFASTGIDSLLRALDCEQLYLLGVSTNMCVETTAREAADRGYLVTLVEDGCGTTHADLHDSTMRNFQRLFGRVCSTDAALEELSGPVAR